jgi:hypothetical protein
LEHLSRFMRPSLSRRELVCEQDDVGPTVALGLDHHGLVDGEPVVVGALVEVDHARLGAADVAVAGAVLDGHSAHEHAVHRAVAGDEVRPFGAGQHSEGVVEGRRRQAGVEARECLAKPPRQDDFAELRALRAGQVGREVGPEGERPSHLAEPCERYGLNVRLIHAVSHDSP